MSRLLRWLFAVLAALLLLSVLAWSWLWHSDSGREFALAQARAALADGALSWQSADGTLAGGVHVQGLVLNVDGVRVQVAQVQLAVAPRALWRGVVRVASLQASGVHVQLPPSPDDSASEPLAWPSQWPTLPLPLVVEIQNLLVNELQWQAGDAAPQAISTIRGGLRMASDRVQVQALTITRAADATRIDGHIDFGARSALALALDGTSLAGAAVPWQLHARISGRPADLQLVLDGQAPGPVSLRARAP